jgi:hypothetical protein
MLHMLRLTKISCLALCIGSFTAYGLAPGKLLTLSARSEPAGAKVILNGEEIGVTPCSKDSLEDGIYTIVFDLHGYKKFSTQILLKPNADKRVFAKLERVFGTLTIMTSPSGAACSVGSGLRGTTPFSCDTLLPGAYSIKLSLDLYAPVSKTVRVRAGDRDTIMQPLVLLSYLDSLKQAHRKKMQNGRKVVFGLASACCLGLGLASDFSARKSLDKQRSDYAAYMGLNGESSAEEFDAKYTEYQNHKTETDKSLSRRNLWYGIGAAFLVGLSISFWF